MGLCRVDLEKGHRQYSVKYALNDREGVASIFKDIHRLRERRFHSADYSASDILADLKTAVDKANLTDRQQQALYYVFEKDLTQKDAGQEMGIAQQAVEQSVNNACEKIAAVFDGWEYGDTVIEYEDSVVEEEEDEI